MLARETAAVSGQVIATLEPSLSILSIEAVKLESHQLCINRGTLSFRKVKIILFRALQLKVAAAAVAALEYSGQ